MSARDPFGIGVDSYNRMQVVLGNREHMQRADWFAQLGDAWSMCDDLARWRTALREILRAATPAELTTMMDATERATLAAMPERIVVWRGCYAVNREGLSWSTDRDVAERFVTLHRYRRLGMQPFLRRGLVRRERAVLKLDRGESEIIAATVFSIAEECLQLERA